MAINTSSDNPLYLAYHNSGPTVDLIGPALLLNLIAFPGVLLNAFVLWTTIRTSSLRGSANFLTALMCLFESVHQFGHLVFLAIVLSGVNFIDMKMATIITIPQIFAMNANLICMFSAAFDRLFAVALTDLHVKIYGKFRNFYLAGHILFIGIYASIDTGFNLIFGFQNPGIPTTGNIGEILPQLGIKWYLSIMFPMVASFLCYCLIGAIVRCNKSVTSQTNMRLMRSLILILCVSVGSYLVGISAYQILFRIDFGLSPIAIWEWCFLPGCILNMGAAANAPILYVNSTEHRKAFRRQFGQLFPGLCKALNMQIVGGGSVQQMMNISKYDNSSIMPKMGTTIRQQQMRESGIGVGGRIMPIERPQKFMNSRTN